MAVPLHMSQGHDGNKAPDVQAGSRRIKADITCNLVLPQKTAYQFRIGNLLDKASFEKNIINTTQIISPYFHALQLNPRTYPTCLIINTKPSCAGRLCHVKLSGPLLNKRSSTISIPLLITEVAGVNSTWQVTCKIEKSAIYLLQKQPLAHNIRRR
jgi:hypothetical protein